jgi:hypothetical protein
VVSPRGRGDGWGGRAAPRSRREERCCARVVWLSLAGVADYKDWSRWWSSLESPRRSLRRQKLNHHGSPSRVPPPSRKRLWAGSLPFLAFSSPVRWQRAGPASAARAPRCPPACPLAAPRDFCPYRVSFRAGLTDTKSTTARHVCTREQLCLHASADHHPGPFVRRSPPPPPIRE